jgi:hypothetical protein
MTSRKPAPHYSPARIALGIVAGVPLILSTAALAGCESDDPGYSKTTHKTVENTPTEKVTTTEVHEKETKVYPPK